MWKLYELEQKKIWESKRNELTDRFRRLFELIALQGGPLELPRDYDAWERSVGHMFAEELGLTSQSTGDANSSSGNYSSCATWNSRIGSSTVRRKTFRRPVRITV